MTASFGPNPDDVITRITEAPTDADALAVLAGISRGLLLAVADLLYVDPYGHGVPWIRAAIIREARS